MKQFNFSLSDQDTEILEQLINNDISNSLYQITKILADPDLSLEDKECQIYHYESLIGHTKEMKTKIFQEKDLPKAEWQEELDAMGVDYKMEFLTNMDSHSNSWKVSLHPSETKIYLYSEELPTLRKCYDQLMPQLHSALERAASTSFLISYE